VGSDKVISKNWTDKERLEVVAHISKSMFDNDAIVYTNRNHICQVLSFLSSATTEFLDNGE
jgi:hypothetical protein